MALVSLTESSRGTSSSTASQPEWLQLGQSPGAAVATTSLVVGTAKYLSPRVFVLR